MSAHGFGQATSFRAIVAAQVMGVNGVSHHIVEDDLAGCTAALQWLAYVPAVLGSLPPVLPSSDPIARPISYTPGPSKPLAQLPPCASSQAV